ncbi:MAG TPA: alpha/beta fold hydrolase [Nocardioidaceae bacterium]|nr:alpha/beta fold hydrolase [Nocardioidaceae bacterium]
MTSTTSLRSRNDRHRGKRTIAVAIPLLAGVLAAMLVDPAGASTASRVDASSAATTGVVAPIPTLDWQPCLGGDLECTRAQVPLDYDHPNGRTTTLFMSRRLADDQADRIGTLFINPGGPGGPAARLVPYFADRLGDRVLRRFDIVGIDPRGIGRSTRVRCQPPGRIPPDPREFIPRTAEQAAPVIDFYTFLAEGCAKDHNAILNHMSTADVARDMDLIRQALGDTQLNYYGISYGSILGQTYAALFPDKVGAMVLDGVANPRAWTTGAEGDTRPVFARVGSGVGSWEALVSGFAECDRVGRHRCRLAGKVADYWRDIVNRLKRGPVSVGGGKVYYSDLVDNTLGALYSPSSYRLLVHEIGVAHRVLAGLEPAGKRTIALFRRGPTVRMPYAPAVLSSSAGPAMRAQQYSLPLEGVMCADTLNPHNPRAWIRAGALADRQGPWFSRDWVWLSNPCAHYPTSAHADAYEGPWHIATSSPVLLVANVHDPATPIGGARFVNTLLAGSRMLTLDQWGHVAMGRSHCVSTKTAAYLVTGALPRNGAVCRGNGQLFPQRD